MLWVLIRSTSVSTSNEYPQHMFFWDHDVIEVLLMSTYNMFSRRHKKHITIKVLKF